MSALGYALVAVVVVTSACSFDDARETAREAPTTTSLATEKPTLSSRARTDEAVAAVHRALEKQGPCRPPCRTFTDSLQWAAASAAALSDADRLVQLGGDTKTRIAIAISTLATATSSLRTCGELSADRHSGIAEEADCRTPSADFNRAVAEFLAASSED